MTKNREKALKFLLARQLEKEVSFRVLREERELECNLSFRICSPERLEVIIDANAF